MVPVCGAFEDTGAPTCVIVLNHPSRIIHYFVQLIDHWLQQGQPGQVPDPEKTNIIAWLQFERPLIIQHKKSVLRRVKIFSSFSILGFRSKNYSKSIYLYFSSSSFDNNESRNENVEILWQEIPVARLVFFMVGLLCFLRISSILFQI